MVPQFRRHHFALSSCTSLRACLQHHSDLVSSLTCQSKNPSIPSRLKLTVSFSADIEITLPTLIQLDKLINLLEAPVFTFLRLQLLEPAQYPYLYKTLYGLLMLLPQSAAFGYLKNRLNSVSPLGYLSMPHPATNRSAAPGAPAPTPGAPAFERAGRLKPAPTREESAVAARVPWNELLERFRTAQEKARRLRQGGAFAVGANEEGQDGTKKALPAAKGGPGSRPASSGDLVPGQVGRIPTLAGRWEQQQTQGQQTPQAGTAGASMSGAGRDSKDQGHRSRFSASNLGRSFVSHARSAGSGISGVSKGKDKR